MKSKPSRPAQPITSSRDFIVEYWLGREQPPVDAQLLGDILKELAEQVGPAKEPSPASIARILADEGAELRHPEIIEFDAEWRERHLVTENGGIGEIERFAAGERLSLEKAETFITKIEALRQQCALTDNESLASELRRVALEVRQRAQTVSRSRAADAAGRAEQSEIDEWLKVWLQTPALFDHWLDLRKRSEEFRQKFPGENK